MNTFPCKWTRTLDSGVNWKPLLSSHFRNCIQSGVLVVNLDYISLLWTCLQNTQTFG
uniref:Uncharacterized protein n=1 Tax=Tetranychus urticae TaxID=32264 RepID=T1K191_TETUR